MLEFTNTLKFTKIITVVFIIASIYFKCQSSHNEKNGRNKSLSFFEEMSFFFFFFLSFCLLRATPTAYGGSQAIRSNWN